MFILNMISRWVAWARPARPTMPPTLNPSTIPPMIAPSRRHGSTGERLCAEIFEAHIGRSVLINFRPDFLKNPLTKRNLEYDCYDPIRKVAIEYNGQQHYEYTPQFHRSFTDFQLQQSRDVLKRKLSSAAGVTLIEVPYVVDTPSRNIDMRRNKLTQFLTPQLKTAYAKASTRKL